MRIGVAEPIPGVLYPSSEDYERYASVLGQQTLIGAIEETFRINADRIAISQPPITVTHGALDRITTQWASALLRVGLKPLDRVIFQVNNSKELVFALFGCLKAGLIPICTLASHRQHEISYLGRHAKARAHIVHGDDQRFDMIDFASRMRNEIPSLDVSLAVRASDVPPEFHSLDRLAEQEDIVEARRRVATVPRDPYQVVLFQLSGGTSDVPKIIPRFSNEYLYSMQAYIRWRHFDETTVGFTPSPMMHNAPLLTYWGPVLLAGGEVAISPNLNLETISHVLRERRPTWFGMPGVIIHRLMNAGLLDRAQFAGAVGFSLPNSGAQISQLTGAPVYQQYGMTEGFISACRRGDSPAVMAATVGQSYIALDSVKIVKPGTTEPVADGEVGELIVKGPCTIKGYFDAPDRDREAFTPDGYYRSGDLLRLRTIDGKSYLCFEGRIKDVIDRGGEKINCQEVERIAILNPRIAAIAIVPMPDPHYGERSCAFVIPATRDDLITVAELGTFLEEKGLAKFKWPERVEIVDEFPMTNSAKLSKPELRRRIVAQLAQESAQRISAGTAE